MQVDCYCTQLLRRGWHKGCCGIELWLLPHHARRSLEPRRDCDARPKRSAEAARDKAEAGRRAAERRAKQAEEELVALKDKAQASAKQVRLLCTAACCRGGDTPRPQPSAPACDAGAVDGGAKAPGCLIPGGG